MHGGGGSPTAFSGVLRVQIPCGPDYTQNKTDRKNTNLWKKTQNVLLLNVSIHNVL